MNELILSPGCEALGRALLHSLWQGAALAALLALVNGRLGARARYGAACAALLALVVSLGITVALCYETPLPGLAPGGLDWIPWLAPVWAAGVLAMSLRLAVAWAGSRRLVRLAGPPLPARWQEVARSLAAKMRVRKRFRLLESARVPGPALVGWLRPAILVPAGALCGLSAAQLEAVLAHELAHLARRDALVNLLVSFAEVALFYHPAAWWIGSRIRREREHCCDDLAVAVCGSAHLYAGALLRLEEARPARRALVFAARDGDLAAHIRRLVHPARTERVEWRAALASLTGLLAIATVAAALTVQEPRPEPPKPPAPAASQSERDRIYQRFGPPDEIVTEGGQERWFYRRLPGVGDRVSFEFRDEGRTAELKSQREALQRSAKELQRRAKEEQVKAVRELERAQERLKRLKEEQRRVEEEAAKLKAEQAGKAR
ncbi:MAG: M48 family metalloprotease [Acidobacteria bacterium]|nr:M48 family metalloprotease [Acidobacteriota bacterium]